MTDLSQLPPGVHPRDPAEPWSPGQIPGSVVVPTDQPGSSNGGTRRKPWDTQNEEALGVFQRASNDWQPKLTVVSGAAPLLVTGRQRGRVSVKLWVPTTVISKGAVITTTAGVMIGSEPEEALDALVLLNVGDSLVLETEASVYAALIPGQTIGFIQSATLTNPLGGELGVY